MAIAIDKNVPIPERHRRNPFGEMEVGDSFFTTSPGIRHYAHVYGKRHGVRFEVHKVEGGFRVWRIV